MGLHRRAGHLRVREVQHQQPRAAAHQLRQRESPAPLQPVSKRYTACIFFVFVAVCVLSRDVTVVMYPCLCSVYVPFDKVIHGPFSVRVFWFGLL